MLLPPSPEIREELDTERQPFPLEQLIMDVMIDPLRRREEHYWEQRDAQEASDE